MTKTTFTEFRKRAKTYLDSVERGETVQILRHGKPIANITPVDEDPNDKPWKKPRVKLVIPGISASRLIIEGRRRERF